MGNIYQWDELIRCQRASFTSFICVKEVMLLLAGCLVCCFVTGGTQTHQHNKGHYFEKAFITRCMKLGKEGALVLGYELIRFQTDVALLETFSVPRGSRVRFAAKTVRLDKTYPYWQLPPESPNSAAPHPSPRPSRSGLAHQPSPHLPQCRLIRAPLSTPRIRLTTDPVATDTQRGGQPSVTEGPQTLGGKGPSSPHPPNSLSRAPTTPPKAH